MVGKVLDDIILSTYVHKMVEDILHRFLHRSVEQSMDQKLDLQFFHNNKYIFAGFQNKHVYILDNPIEKFDFGLFSLVEVWIWDQQGRFLDQNHVFAVMK